MSYDAIVLGGGPAGLLAADVLGRSGRNVLCLDDAFGNPSPQAAHVHHFPAAAWARLAAFWPDLEEDLAQAGAVFADAAGATCPPSQAGARPCPDRPLLDRLLPRRKLSGVELVSARAHVARWRQGAWQVELTDAPAVRGRWLVDATGRARKSLGWVASLRGEPVAVDEGPRSGTYRSAVFASSGLAPGRAILRERRGPGMGLLGVRLGPGRWRLTLTHPSPAPGDARQDPVLVAPAWLRQRLARTRRMTPWVRAGAQPASLLALDEVGPVAGWLVIGDGLLTTAPYQGNGFAQLLDQAEALASGLQAEERTADLRLRLFESARRAWFQAACVDCFTAANRPDNEPHPTRRPQAAPGSTGEPLTRTTASRLQ